MMEASLTELRRRGRKALSGNWGNAIGIMLVMGLITIGLAFTFIGPLIATGAFMVGSAIFYINITRKKNAQFSDLFSGFSKFGVAFVSYLLTAIFTFFWSLLFIIPGIIKSFSYSLTYYIVADDENISATDAITKSREMMNGFKGKMFLLQLSFIGWAILSVFTFGILLLWLSPYMSATMAAFYEEVKSIKYPTQAPIEILTDDAPTSSADPFKN